MSRNTLQLKRNWTLLQKIQLGDVENLLMYIFLKYTLKKNNLFHQISMKIKISIKTTYRHSKKIQ